VKVTGLVDEAARRTIREALDTTLVVEAAAGTGKTSELVQRVAAVIRSGRGRVGSLIAVTFTEKAAGEMKLRLRTELDRALSDAEGAPEVHARLRAALSELETARIGTIHGLCGELLRAHPVEAGVDPAFRTADEELSQRLLRAEFEHWLDSLRKAPPPGVLRVLSRGRIDDGEDGREALWFALRALTDTRDFDALYRYPEGFDRARELPRVARELYALGKLAAPVQSPKDPLRKALAEIKKRLHAVRGASLGELEAALRALSKKRDLWDQPGRGERFGSELRADVIKRRDAARADLLAVMAKASAELAAHLCRELREVVARYEAQKAREGVLDFFDLLLRARQLLRDAPHVRRALADGTTHVFVDEFQDVDPVQGEILLYLASADPAESDPYAAPLVPGKLCVVGDPKQSIYRFRRADIALYDRIKRHLVTRGAEVATLSTSFRSVPALQSVVNAAFAPWMGGDASLGQAAYVPLSAFRAGRPGQPAVVALPAPRPFSDYAAAGSAPKVTKKAVNGSLPDAVAAYIDWLVRESGYVVEEGGVDVPVAARHVCLLFKRFRSWEGDVTRPYVRALEARRVPHVLSGGRGLFEREEVRALMAALTAVEWPDDELAVYATLRGPFAGFSDDVLLRYRLTDGSLSPFRADPEAHAEAPELREVAEVLSLVRRLHYARNAEAASGTIARLLAALRAHAGVAIWPTGEQALGNLLRIAELARAFEQRPEATSFRAFLAYLEARAAQGEMADATVVEESSDGVRLMTVHGSKGLEFPVVVLCDPAAPLRVEHPSRYIDSARGLWAQALCGAEPEELAEHRAEVTAHDEAELVRLTYVAATRAKEMLVVPSTAEGPLEGWLELLRPAVHPASEQARKTQPSALRLPAFGPTSFVIHEHDQYADPERGVIPGVHRPAQGDHELVVWDPCLLGPRETPLAGVSQEELLKADGAEGRDEAGLLAYRAHVVERTARRERGATPSYHVRSVTGEAALAEAQGEGAARSADDAPEPREADVLAELSALGVTLIDTGAARDLGLGGTRFGRLVHALFEYARPGGPSLDVLSGALARTLGASEHERAHAVERVARAQEHPFWKRIEAADARGEAMREAQLVALRAPGELVEGVADLVCFEEHAGARSVLLVDFKTDGRLVHATRYARQLDAYAAALRAALGMPVERALFWV
jgi:ATP-dependent helicase/nuclease subunit A